MLGVAACFYAMLVGLDLNASAQAAIATSLAALEIVGAGVSVRWNSRSN